jgi:ABC-type multidrug transport system fused ATPase/permease subunit
MPESAAPATLAAPAASAPAAVIAKRSTSRLVRELLRPYYAWLIIVLVAMVVETAMSIAAPWPLKIVLDNAVGHDSLPRWLDWVHDLGLPRDTMGLAAFAGIAAVIIATLGAIATYIDNYFTESVGQWVAHDLRVRIYDHLTRLSLSYYDKEQSGALLSTITNDVATVQDFASSATLDILIDLMTIVGMLGIMFWLNWDFALIAVGVTPFLLFFIARFKKAVKNATREVRKRQSDIVSVVQQGLGSMRIVKAYGRQDLEAERMNVASRATIGAALRARSIKSLLSPIVTIVVAFCTAFVLWRGTSLILAGTLTVGALTVFLAYLTKFFKPVQDLAKMTNTIAQTAIGLERIQRILDADMIIPERAGARTVGPQRGDIRFEHIAFGYDASAPVLRDVCLTIAPGQHVGIVGPTGSGKSTIVSLIPRFYEPASGRITIDGVELGDYSLAALRRQIGFVLQDTALFHGTVRENIAYGRPDATDDAIIAAAKLANADEFIDKMPLGYDSMIGERGGTLSGGQRQRIGIARAVIRNAPILILDEPTAALDTESEKLVIEGLERLMRGRTVITIAHRLATIRNADKIVVLKDGVVAEEGGYDELLQRGGIFAELHRIQYDTTAAEPTP